MWDKLFAWLRVAWDSGAETQRNSKLIRETQEQSEQFARMIQLLFVQQTHERELREKEISRLESKIASLESGLERQLRDEAEKTELRLRLEMMKEMRQLPPHRQEDK